MEELHKSEEKPYANLRGRELVVWALHAGRECMDELGPVQTAYFSAISRRAGVAWPEGFFASNVEQLMKTN